MKRRVLFVDDEIKVLEGLRRMLRCMRQEWEIGFANSGQEALDLLNRYSFDVVVSDMRMPGMNGSELMAQVKERFPATVRIILSGYSDQEEILKSVRSTQWHLSKPCNADVLKATVARACALRDLLNNETLIRVVSGIDSIPCMPSLYGELLDELESADSSIQRIGQIIAKDVGMSAKILQLVNSAFFGLPQRVTDVSRAINLLGLETVKTLVITLQIFSQYTTIKLPGFSISALWKHSLMTGSYAKAIAKAEGLPTRVLEDCFTAGLLHDVGKLILIAGVPDPYREIMLAIERTGCPLWKAELEILQTTHAQVGAYLMGLWGLPDPVVEAIAFHHSPSLCPAGGIGPLMAVHVGDGLEQPGSDQNGVMDRLDSDYLERLHVADRLADWKGACESVSARGA